MVPRYILLLFLCWRWTLHTSDWLLLWDTGTKSTAKAAKAAATATTQHNVSIVNNNNGARVPGTRHHTLLFRAFELEEDRTESIKVTTEPNNKKEKLWYSRIRQQQAGSCSAQNHSQAVLAEGLQLFTTKHGAARAWGLRGSYRKSSDRPNSGHMGHPTTKSVHIFETYLSVGMIGTK